MSKRVHCLGGCGITIGTGCGCCSDDFPEEHGYCLECFQKSSQYEDKMQSFFGILDRLDESGIALLLDFIENYDADFERFFLEILRNRKLHPPAELCA